MPGTPSGYVATLHLAAHTVLYTSVPVLQEMQPMILLDGDSVCVCVCVTERERERERFLKEGTEGVD